MSDDIISFYKKPSNDHVDESTELSVNEPVVTEETSDPFHGFLNTLAETIKKTKANEFNKTEQTASNITEAKDPFDNFLVNVASIIKKDEKIQTDEQIKEATIGFIEKLKEEPVTEGTSSKKQKAKYLPNKLLKKIAAKKSKAPLPVINLETGLPEVDDISAAVSEQKEETIVQKVNTVTEDVVEETEPQTNNTYVKQLETIDKNKREKNKITKPGDIKGLIEKQVREQINKLRQELSQVAMTAGGGGSVAVQYANGGTMNGDLNVTGKYLSGGRDLSTIFTGGGGGGSSDRLISGAEQLVLNFDGSVTFPDNTIRPPEDTIISLESENTALSAFTRVSLSPYAFFAYDVNSNSITFDSIDNTITLTSQDQYEWLFNDKGELIGPSNILTVNSDLSTIGKILSGGRDLADIFLTTETDSQTLSYTPSSFNLSISNGNTVSLASLSSVPTDLSFLSVSGNWNTAYNIATAYQNVSSSFVTNSTVNTLSSLLTPLTLTKTLTSQLVLNSDFNAYQTDVAATTATLLPVSIYQNASGNWQNAYDNAVFDVKGTTNQIVATKTNSTPGNNSYTLSFPNSAAFPGSVSIAGNLTVAGTAAYINVDNLVVKDNLIYLNDGNYGSNVLDIGIVANFTQGPLGYQHTGLVRRAEQGYPGVWTLFSGLTTEPLSAANLDWNDKNIVIDSLSANILGNLSGDYVTVGTGNSDQWNYSYNVATFVQANSANWEESAEIIPTVTNYLSTTPVDLSSVNVFGALLSGGRDLKDIFLTTETDSQTLSYTPSSYELSISNGNTVSLASLSSVPTDLSFLSVSGNWNTAYNIATAYQSTSGSFVTSTVLNSVSSQLVTNSTFNSYQTSVAASTATLLPTTVYQNASGAWNDTYTIVSTNSAAWNALKTEAATIQIELPDNKDYILDARSAYTYTISAVHFYAVTGTGNLSLEINNVILPEFNQRTITNTLLTIYLTTNNTISSGQTLTAMVSNNSFMNDLIIEVIYYR